MVFVHHFFVIVCFCCYCCNSLLSQLRTSIPLLVQLRLGIKIIPLPKLIWSFAHLVVLNDNNDAGLVFNDYCDSSVLTPSSYIDTSLVVELFSTKIDLLPQSWEILLFLFKICLNQKKYIRISKQCEFFPSSLCDSSVIKYCYHKSVSFEM